MSGVIAVAATVGTALGATGAGAALVGGLAIAGVATSAAGLGYTIAAGEDAKRKQADSLGRQQAAQQQAVNAAQGQRKRSEMAMNRANQQQPNVAGIMEAASAASSGGAAGTMLTGPTGVDPNALALGKSSLLGS
jgi:hypothetical protein